MADGERVVVFGGTAGTGELIARRLLEEGYTVRVAARTPERAERRFGGRVEVVRADVTERETLPPAVRDATHLIYTVGAPRNVARRETVRATVYRGTLDTLAAAEEAGLPGRFMCMSALGTTRRSFLGALLNLMKGNTLELRREVEDHIRRSGLSHTIIHAGILRDVEAGRRPVRISQEEYALRPRYRIGRADVAEVFVRALASEETAGTTFDAVWGREGEPALSEQFRDLRPDGAG